MARDDTGRRAICGNCNLVIERHPPIWLDHGGNARCNRPGSPLHLADGENVWTLLSPIAKRHMAAVCGGEVTKSNVIGLRKIFNHLARLEQRLSGNRSAAVPSDGPQLSDALERCQPRVTGELHDSGLAVLRSPRYAKRLAPYAEQIARLQFFRLIGFEWIDSLHCVAVYRAFTVDGPAFKFRVVPWQAVIYSRDSDLVSGPEIRP